jgi:acetyl-CoA carboxylase biotin carboxyl carrier protein
MASKKRGDADSADDSYVAVARGLAEVVSEHNLSELILDTKDVKLTVRRGGPVATAPMATFAPAAPLAIAPAPTYAAAPAALPAPVAASPAVAPVEDKANVVTSPFVGTFYRKPNPDSPAYVQLNEKIEKGQVLCIVEAMKLMNEIEADVAGTIVGILVEDGAPVEYGQPLFRIAV